MEQEDVYFVRLQRFVARQLPAMDANGLSDPYLILNFDGIEMKTDICLETLNPIWAFSNHFEYKVPKDADLTKRILKIECWDHDRFLTDDFIGSRQITLDVILLGPKKHILNFYSVSGEKCGEFEFSVEAHLHSEVEINLDQCVADLSLLRTLNNCTIQATLLPRQVSIRSGVGEGGAVVGWESIGKLSLTCHLQELLESILAIGIFEQSVLAPVGVAYIRIGSSYTHHQKTEIQFDGNIELGGSKLGTIQLHYRILNAPGRVQMKDGTHTEAGIIGATPWISGVPLPDYVRKKTSAPTTPNFEATNLFGQSQFASHE
eukprot:TRINITY_DN7942_c0_g1_i2.p1 TRINITY_DN7942_c0_g1~~TRINITY_DN7942_c0_g1_i2.p1  ORF type:complete len:318 (+),score=41.44 TRINITY_DN7942_c0_g1_i2:91-1044(+)